MQGLERTFEKEPIEVKTNIVFAFLHKSENRITVNQGGTRSGKTYNILLWILLGYASFNTGKIITICRKTFPSLRATAMRDFLAIMERCGKYNPANHNKTQNEILYNGNIIEFIGVDQPQKVRGRKRHVLFINEANELTLEDWRQLSLRTSEKIIIDYNPSFDQHWIFDEVIPRDDADFLKTTYRNNPFLEPELVREIERLQEVDEWYWTVYGEGESAASKEIIYRLPVVDIDPVKLELPVACYGLDFGYSNNPSCLVAVYRYNGGYVVDELFYEAGLGNKAIAAKLEECEVTKTPTIWADSAEPKSIDEIAEYRYNIMPAIKGPDSVRTGISFIQQEKVSITSRSHNAIKESRNYKWKVDRDGNVLNEPVKLFDHAMDAMRYAIYSEWGYGNRGQYHIR